MAVKTTELQQKELYDTLMSIRTDKYMPPTITPYQLDTMSNPI